MDELAEEFHRLCQKEILNHYRPFDKEVSFHQVEQDLASLEKLGYLSKERSEWALWGSEDPNPEVFSWYRIIFENLGLVSVDLAFRAMQTSLQTWLKNRTGKQEVFLLFASEEPLILLPQDVSLNHVYLADRKNKQWKKFKVVKQVPLEKRLGLPTQSLSRLTLQQEIETMSLNPLFSEILFREVFSLLAIESGLIKLAYDTAYTYAQDRYQGGKLIIDHDIIQEMLQKIEKAILHYDSIIPYLSTKRDLASLIHVRTTCSNFALEASWSAMQIHGGYGYMKDYGMEQIFRHIRMLRQMPASPLFLIEFLKKGKQVV
ncbi:MAG: hypothetical protein D6767_10240 [Candidatus Hydrogenedentota bacterium]|nr:MAG: hypothetical protein D6767_10240 [Candidatus Hydrogenedentota bacterium]